MQSMIQCVEGVSVQNSIQCSVSLCRTEFRRTRLCAEHDRYCTRRIETAGILYQEGRIIRCPQPVDRKAGRFHVVGGVQCLELQVAGPN